MQQLDHPNSFTSDERAAGHCGHPVQTQRSRAAAFVRTIVIHVDEVRKRRDNGETVHVAQEVSSMFKDGDAFVPLNTIRYTTHMLEYYFDCTFDRDSGQTRATMVKQIGEAVDAAACHTGTGPGRMKEEVVRQWDFGLDDMVFEARLLMQTPEQLKHCFGIVHLLYTVNFDINRFAKDVFHYRHCDDALGMTKFGGDQYLFARVLRTLFTNFTQSVQHLLRRTAFEAAVAKRTGIGQSDRKRKRPGAGGGWSAWALYIFTSQLAKHVSDGRLYMLEDQEKTSWIQSWCDEGQSIIDGSKLRVPNARLIPLAREVTEALSTQLRLVSDIPLRKKDDFVDEMACSHLDSFCAIVRQLAPSEVLLCASAKKRVDPMDTTLERVWKSVMRALWNTRVKMLKNNDLTLMQELLTASFRGDKASKQAESTTEAYKTLHKLTSE